MILDTTAEINIDNTFGEEEDEIMMLQDFDSCAGVDDTEDLVFDPDYFVMDEVDASMDVEEVEPEIKLEDAVTQRRKPLTRAQARNSQDQQQQQQAWNLVRNDSDDSWNFVNIFYSECGMS